MKVDGGLLAICRKQEFIVLAAVHKHILYEHTWAKGSPDDIEICLQIGISIGIVGTQPLSGKMQPCRFI